MDLLTGVFSAAAALLAVAGVPKLASPLPAVNAIRSVGLPASRAAVRALGAGEVLVGTAAVLVGGTVLASLVAVQYTAFAVFVALALRRGGAVSSCGCFGAEDTPPTLVHLGVDVVAALVAGGAAVAPVAGLTTTLASSPLAGVPFLAATATCVWLAHAALTVLPEVSAAASPRRRNRSPA